jgi:hypothetical protein
MFFWASSLLLERSASAQAPTPNKALAIQCASQAEQASEFRDKGRLREAEALLTECARDACPKIVREDCRKAVSELRSQSPFLSVRLRDQSGSDVGGAEIRIDAKVVKSEDLARGILMDPGEHRISAKHPTLGTVDETVVIVRGDKLRSVALVLKGTETVATPTAKPAAAATATTQPLSTERNRTAAYVVGGVGLVVFGVGAALGASGYVGYSSLAKECAPKCGDRGDAPQLRARIGDVTMGVGLVTVVVATVLWFLAPRVEVDPKKADGATSILRF